jgi:hypothetical protein
VPADADGDGDRRWQRELNHHLFIPSLIVSDPFLATEFSLQTSAGLAWVDGPSFDVRGNPAGSDTYLAASLFEAASFQLNLLHWWALRIGGTGGLAGGGFRNKSALVLGATVPLDVVAGTTVSWRIGKFVRLGGTFDFDYEHARTIEPLAAVQSSLAINQADSSQALQRVNSYTVIPGVAAAFAPLAAVGIVASAQYGWIGKDDGTTTTGESNLIFGLSAQLDVRRLIPRAAVGFVASYRARIPLSSSEEVAHDLEGGVYYTGRNDLVLGLVAQGRWFELRPGFDAASFLINAVIRYYWN